MAYKNSGPLAAGASYTLGKYTFTIGRDYSEDEGTTTIIAACTDGTRRGYKRIPMQGDVRIESWHVNANDTTADVYVSTNHVPVRIEVTTPPTQTEYIDGELLNPAGIVLTAYYEDGTEWGHPTSDVTYIPHYADVSQVASDSGASSDLDTNWAQPIPLYTEAIAVRNSSYYARLRPADGAVMLVVTCTTERTYVVFASKTSGVVGTNTAWSTPTVYSSNKSYTHDGKTVHWKSVIGEPFNFSYDYVVPEVAQRAGPDNNTIWTAVYGTITTEGAQSITVKWKRPVDGEELETSFDIFVTGSTNNG